MNRTIFVAVSAAVLTGTFSVACDKDPPLAPEPQRIVNLELTGPAAIAPGDTEQYRVVAVPFSGQRRDVTSEAVWNSADGTILSIGANGRATAGERGETDLRVTFSGLTATRRVLVLPPGTFKLSGKVLDANAGVSDARVEVTAGSASGLWTLSRDGHYALYGVAGPIEVKATREGYLPRVQKLDISRHLIVDLPLALIRPPWDPSGTYRLTITAAAECREALPDVARSRTYQSVIAPDGRFASVTIPNIKFAFLSWTFWYGRLDADSLTFEDGYGLGHYYYGPPLVEQIGPNQYYQIRARGSVARGVVRLSPTGLEGPLDATITVRAGDAWYNSLIVAECGSADHRLTFTR